MIASFCTRCGKCCMHMGEIVGIDEATGDFEFSVRIDPVMSVFAARIDDRFRDLFLDRAWIEDNPSACPFLRPEGMLFTCTIHEKRPGLCQTYFCRN
ncbi:MAG: YkgJ family cysteine cluster protein [Methanomicrobiaceae archaeon]|nr:YkgJ family cysteine cluster protein [Methanomicrobiaceae archaeon]